MASGDHLGMLACMVRVTCDGDQVVVRVLGWHVLWACRRTLTVARRCVRSVQMARDAGITRPEGLRCPGTYIPGIIAAGTYRRRGGTAFWDVRHLDRAVVFDLDDAPWARLVVEVEDPAATLRLFQP